MGALPAHHLEPPNCQNLTRISMKNGRNYVNHQVGEGIISSANNNGDVDNFCYISHYKVGAYDKRQYAPVELKSIFLFLQLLEHGLGPVRTFFRNL